jgi:PAS domain S-box-containing protein
MRRPDSPLVYANKGFERLTGYPREEVLHRNCRFLQDGAQDREQVRAIREALQAEQEYSGELLNFRKDGTPFWNRLSLTPVRDNNGRVTHYVGVQSDITARVQAETDLRHTLELLQRANDQLSAANSEMHRNLAAAAAVQNALLPASTPACDRVRFAWQFRPCDELAGDILNVFRLDDRHVGMYLLDVAGHGIAAALLAVSVSRLLAPNSHESSIIWTPGPGRSGYAITPPAEVANHLNQRFPWDSSVRQFFTLIYGVLDLRTCEFRFVSAGHPAPLLVSRHHESPLPKSKGLPIGLERHGYQDQVVQLVPGDRLVLFSDGVTDAMDAERNILGPERILEQLRRGLDLSLDESLARLLNAVDAWQAGTPQRDDLSLLAVEIAA